MDQQGLLPAATSPVIHMRSPNAWKGRKPHYPAVHATALGVVLILCGIVTVVLAVLSYSPMIPIWYMDMGPGVLTIVAGAFGICAGKNKRRAMVITHLVLATLSAISAVNQFFTGTRYKTWSYHYEHTEDEAHKISAVAITLMVSSAVQILAAVWLSAIGCRFACCLCCRACCCTCYETGNDMTLLQNVEMAQLQILVTNPPPVSMSGDVQMASAPAYYSDQATALPPPPYQHEVKTQLKH